MFRAISFRLCSTSLCAAVFAFWRKKEFLSFEEQPNKKQAGIPARVFWWRRDPDSVSCVCVFELCGFLTAKLEIVENNCFGNKWGFLSSDGKQIKINCSNILWCVQDCVSSRLPHLVYWYERIEDEPREVEGVVALDSKGRNSDHQVGKTPLSFLQFLLTRRSVRTGAEQSGQDVCGSTGPPPPSCFGSFTGPDTTQWYRWVPLNLNWIPSELNVLRNHTHVCHVLICLLCSKFTKIKGFYLLLFRNKRRYLGFCWVVRVSSLLISILVASKRYIMARVFGSRIRGLMPLARTQPVNVKMGDKI